MKRILAGFAALACGAIALQRHGTGHAPAEGLRVLFIGNSYTFFNDLPGRTAHLAASARPPRALETRSVTEGGATLRRHWDAGRALEAMRDGKWDYVVLQEQGTLGQGPVVRGVPQVNDPKRFHADARLFDAEIKKAGARTIFYLTWARRSAPQSQARLTDAYAAIAGELGARVAPVGVAWQSALKENPTLALHHPDGSHPSEAGTYLAACVFYAVLYSSSPEGLSPSPLGEPEAAFLQRIAWQTVRPRL